MQQKHTTLRSRPNKGQFRKGYDPRPHQLTGGYRHLGRVHQREVTCSRQVAWLSRQEGALMTTPANWTLLLQEAVSQPGLIHSAYTVFHQYSFGNQVLALVQCQQRGLEPGPL